MLQKCLTEDDRVVSVETYNVPLEVRENAVHETIEHGPTAGPSVRKSAVLKEAMVCDKCEEMTVFFEHIAAVIAREAVKRVTEKW
jgi:hypothetical protein